MPNSVRVNEKKSKLISKSGVDSHSPVTICSQTTAKEPCLSPDNTCTDLETISMQHDSDVCTDLDRYDAEELHDGYSSLPDICCMDVGSVSDWQEVTTTTGLGI